MAKVLLFYPNMRLLGFRFPYSLLPLAAYAKKRGHDVTLLDSQVEDYRTVNPKDFDLIGISTLTGLQIRSSLEFARFCRNNAPQTPIVWGGVHPSLTPDQTILNPLVDIVCRGEGEETLAELLDNIKTRDFSGVKGITYKEGGRVVVNPDRHFMDLNTVPVLPYDLLKVDRYVELKRKPSLIYMETSRGCPHRCGFCYDVAMHKRQWRAKEPGAVADEIGFLVKKYSVQEVWFTDDEFAVNGKRVASIAEEILKRNIKIRWPLFSRANYVCKYDGEYLKLLKASGCDQINFGVETGSERLLKFIKKDITLDQVRESVEILKRNGILSGLSFMMGFPTETLEEMRQTFDFIDEMIVRQPSMMIGQISVFTPLPSTDLMGECVKYGFREPQSLEKWGDYIYNDYANLNYLGARELKLVKTVSLLTKFDFGSDIYRGAGILETKPLLKLMHKTLWKSARARWKRKYFGLPLEWRGLDMALRLMKLGER